MSVTGVDSEFKNPRATQVGGGIERELVTNFSLGADVIYVKTDRLQCNRGSQHRRAGATADRPGAAPHLPGPAAVHAVLGADS